MSRETNKPCVSGAEEHRSPLQIVSVLHNKTEGEHVWQILHGTTLLTKWFRCVRQWIASSRTALSLPASWDSWLDEAQELPCSRPLRASSSRYLGLASRLRI